MKLDKLLEDKIRIKFNPRKPLFFARTKMVLQAKPAQWSENCHGILVIYQLNNAYYMCVLNIIKFQILFDMEIYSNFTKYAKFIGQNKFLVFMLPCKKKVLQVMMVLESRQQLTEIKRILQSIDNKSNEFDSMDFFQQQEVHELIKAAQIDQQMLESNLRFRNEAQKEIRDFFDKINNIEKKKSVSGFKAYGLGREEWKLQAEQIEYLKDTKKGEVIQNLIRLQRQARMA